VSERLEPREKSRLRRTMLLIAAVPLLLASSGVLYLWWDITDDPTCAAGALMACSVCCGGEDRGPVEPEDPETVQFPDAADLTAGAAGFTPTDAFVNVAPAVWIPDPEAEGWTPIPSGDLLDAQSGFEADGARLLCYAADQRTIAIADFLDDENVFSAIAVAQRALYDEASVYERTTEPVFGHYRVDGNAVLAAEAEYTWTTEVDPETGDTSEGEWTERWGFVAVYRGSAGASICSYGGPSDAEALEILQEHLLGLRLSD
jgi:hypothetical protein